MCECKKNFFAIFPHHIPSSSCGTQSQIIELIIILGKNNIFIAFILFYLNNDVFYLVSSPTAFAMHEAQFQVFHKY